MKLLVDDADDEDGDDEDDDVDDIRVRVTVMFEGEMPKKTKNGG